MSTDWQLKLLALADRYSGNFKGQKCRSLKSFGSYATALCKCLVYLSPYFCELLLEPQLSCLWQSIWQVAIYIPRMTRADVSVKFLSKHPLQRLKLVMAFDFFQSFSTEFWNENLGFKCNLRFKPSEFLAGTVASWPQGFQKARRHAMNVHANLEDSARAVIKWRISLHGTICTLCLAGRSNSFDSAHDGH
eukprot:s719_g13.t1